MESPLTILLLIKNNKETIDQFLSSIEEINYKLIVGNMGSTDGTVEKLLHKNAQIVPLSFDDDLSKLRNFLISKVKSGWILHLEPFEQIISGIDLLKKSISGPAACYSFPVIQGDTLTKQNKLWHTSLNLKFTNPVYETIDSESKLLNCYITSQSIPQQFDVKPIIKKWHQSNPLSPDPIYYLACAELFDKNWDSFTENVTSHSPISESEIPNSLYYSVKPDYFGDLTWPPFNPNNPWQYLTPPNKTLLIKHFLLKH